MELTLILFWWFLILLIWVPQWPLNNKGTLFPTTYYAVLIREPRKKKGKRVLLGNLVIVFDGMGRLRSRGLVRRLNHFNRNQIHVSF